MYAIKLLKCLHNIVSDYSEDLTSSTVQRSLFILQTYTCLNQFTKSNSKSLSHFLFQRSLLCGPARGWTGSTHLGPSFAWACCACLYGRCLFSRNGGTAHAVGYSEKHLWSHNLQAVQPGCLQEDFVILEKQIWVSRPEVLLHGIFFFSFPKVMTGSLASVPEITYEILESYTNSEAERLSGFTLESNRPRLSNRQACDSRQITQSLQALVSSLAAETFQGDSLCATLPVAGVMVYPKLWGLHSGKCISILEVRSPVQFLVGQYQGVSRA